MNILFQLSHPAHFHLYKNVIKSLSKIGYNIHIVIKTKEVLEDLLINEGLPYLNIFKNERKKSVISSLWGMLVRDYQLCKYCKHHKIDMMVSSGSETAQVGKLLKIKTINVGEDDISVVPLFKIFGFPFLKELIVPEVCDVGSFNKRAVKYAGNQKLGYLHPNYFTPDKSIVEKYFSADKPYFILRFAKLNAYHDVGITGINSEIAKNLITILNPYGDVYITSERQLEPEFEPYRIQINPLDIHHIMSFSSLYIGDSQSMAVEAGVLGVPFVRFNDFVGRISVLRELEDDYQLGFGVKTNEVERLFEVVKQLLDMPDRNKVYQQRRKIFLQDKIDFTKFLTWFINDYPESKTIMKTNPNYQFTFL